MNNQEKRQRRLEKFKTFIIILTVSSVILTAFILLFMFVFAGKRKEWLYK